MESDFFTRKFEETYGEEALTELQEVLDESEHVVEAFCGLLAQIDVLVEDEDVDLTVGDYYGRSVWALYDVVQAAKETAILAYQQNKPAAFVIDRLAEAVADVIADAKASNAVAKADSDGNAELFAELAERERSIHYVRDSAKATIERLRSGDAWEPATPEAADEESPLESFKAETELKLVSGLTIKFDDAPATPAPVTPEKPAS